MDVICQKISDIDNLNRLAEQWRLLWVNSSTATMANSFEWTNCWARTLLEHAELQLNVMTFWCQQQLVAILPLVKHTYRKQIYFIGVDKFNYGDLYPEHCDILISNITNSQKQAISRCLQSELTHNLLDCGLLSHQAYLNSILTDLKPFKIAKLFNAYQVNLSEGFDDYLEKRSTNARQQFRKLLRICDSHDFKFEYAESATAAQEYLAELIKLHQTYWQNKKNTGAFASQEIIDFHNKLIADGLVHGIVQLTKLKYRSETIAVHYGFIAKKRFEFYQSGVAHQKIAVLNSPGIALHLLTMRYLASKGIIIYDFLAGESEYKKRLANSSYSISRVKVCQKNLHGLFNLFSTQVIQKFKLI